MQIKMKISFLHNRSYLSLFLSIICLIFIVGCIYDQPNNIKSIVSFNEIDFNAIKPDTLITFDIDDTLITDKDSTILGYGIPLAFWLRFLLYHPSLLMSYEYVTSLLFTHSPRRLTEQAVVPLINILKKQCSVIGLTSMESGAWGIISSMPEWRYNMLASMEITFSAFDDRVFNQLPMRRGVYPILYKGILCANQQPKGLVLGAFIDSLESKLLLIISIDDTYDALCSIAQACKERGIPYLGYHYIGAKNQKKLLDYQRAFKQLEILISKKMSFFTSKNKKKRFTYPKQ